VTLKTPNPPKHFQVIPFWLESPFLKKTIGDLSAW
jgi:hypothetical protein